MASTVEKRVHPPPSTPRILPILYSLTQNAVGSSGPNSTVADGAARSASSVSDFGAGKPFPMGQSQLQDYSYRWSGGHEETDRDRAGGSYRRLGRGRIFRSPENAATPKTTITAASAIPVRFFMASGPSVRVVL